MDNKEVEKFEQYGDNWWNSQKGEFKLLHEINPLRIEFIKKHIINHFDLIDDRRLPLSNLKILDVGCGGGLATIPLAKMGAIVTGIDPSPKAINAANKRAEQLGLKNIKHICTMPEDFTLEQQFDVVVCLDVLEHSLNLAESCALLAKFSQSSGAVFISTINKTIKALLLGIITAEYLLKMLPKGTHNYNKLIDPARLERDFSTYGFSIKALEGINFSILKATWLSNADISINYLAYLVNKTHSAKK